MKIAVPSLPAGRHVFSTSAEASSYEDLVERTGLHFCAPIDVEAVVHRMTADIFVRATIRTACRMECARCLAPLDVPMTGRFEMLYVPERREPDEWSPAGREERESQRIAYYSGAIVDLDEQIVQALVLAVPMKPLCRRDCKGLCPTCGRNLNEGPCGCGGRSEFGQPFKGLFC